MINYQKDLNSQQLEVVLNATGSCLVLAGAGSGKTRTITYRVAYLLEQGVSPDNILLLTFTNKAAGEMIERIKLLTGMGHKLPFAGTFHGIAHKILRRYARALNYENNFTILDSDDSKALIKICIKDYKPDSAQRFPSANILQSIISYARNAEITIEDVLDLRYPQWLEFVENIKNIADAYADKKKYANSMDFDDLLVNFLLLLNKPDIVERFSNQFKYILVDEYQDTNKIQASIIRKLSLKHNNVLVVGDDAQSIYSFRAADVNNILGFEKKYPNAKIFKLETNYRSSQEILDVANEVISNNIKQYKKELNTLSQSGIRPVLHPQSDQQDEARFIVKKIKDKLVSGLSPKEISVLFRAAFHSQMLEMELVKAGIDYDFRGGLRFFDRAHIKDVLAYLRIISNLNDTTAWLRVLLHEEGIGPAAAQKVIEQVKHLLSSRAEPIQQAQDGIYDQVRQVGYDVLGERAKQGWNNFVQIWDVITIPQSPPSKGGEGQPVHKSSPSDLIQAIKDSNYQYYLESEFVDAKERMEDIEQLAVFADQAKNLDEFLAEASLQEGFNGQVLSKKQNSFESRIVLSTIHQAKGLEWDSVFVINLAGGAFPNERAWKEVNGIEEERRLFYVAITRAKKYLYLTYPMEKEGWGGSISGPSMFLEEISTDLLDDRSLLSTPGLVLDDLNDESEDVRYISEESQRPTIRPGSFLIDVDDL